jgi:hypothetical protein
LTARPSVPDQTAIPGRTIPSELRRVLRLENLIFHKRRRAERERGKNKDKNEDSIECNPIISASQSIPLSTLNMLNESLFRKRKHWGCYISGSNNLTARGEEHAFLHKSKFKNQISYGGQKRVDGPRAVENVKIHFLKTLPTNKYDEERITKIKLNKSRYVRFFVACFCLYPSFSSRLYMSVRLRVAPRGDGHQFPLFILLWTKKRGKKTCAVSAAAAAESAPAAAVQIATKQKVAN